jgi:Transposase DDE domain
VLHRAGERSERGGEPGTVVVDIAGCVLQGGQGGAVAAGLPGAGDGQLTVLGDTAYGTGEPREHLQASGHVAVIKPPPLPRAVPGGFTIDDFPIDDQAATATCPAGHTAALGRPQADGNRAAQFKARCRDCPLRQRCTTAKDGRVLTVHPHHALLAAARRAAALNLRRLVNLGLTRTSDGNWALT